MEIYILFYKISKYDGDDVIGAYSSKKRAEEAADKYHKKRWSRHKEDVLAPQSMKDKDRKNYWVSEAITLDGDAQY